MTLSRQRMNMTIRKGTSLSLLLLGISLVASPLVAAFVSKSQQPGISLYRASTTTTRRHGGEATETTASTATASCRLFLEGSVTHSRLQYAGVCSKLFSASSASSSSSSSSASENTSSSRLSRRPFSLIQRFRLQRQRIVGRIRQQLQSTIRISNANRKFQRAILVLMMVAMFWTSTARMMTLPAHAETGASTSTASTSVAIGTLQPDRNQQVATVVSSTSTTMDRMIDRYVKQHMFDDEPYDPVASLYREAHDDATVGAYPNALRQLTGSILGQQEGGSAIGAAATTAGGSISFGNIFAKSIQFLHKRLHLSEQVAVIVLAGAFVVVGPTFFLFGGMIVGGISKRNMNKLMKKRYGDTYTVDATIRTEEEVEAPDDDEDEDDDDEGEDDEEEEDDDDDDDDDEEEKDDKKKKK